MISHVFDSSAVLAHFFHDAGADVANGVLTDERYQVAITGVSLIDLKARLFTSSRDAAARAEAEHAYSLYAEQLLDTIPLSRAITDEAARLVSSVGGDLSAIELLTAAAAKIEKAVLVHKNPHFVHLPEGYVRQIPLGGAQ